MRALVLRLDRSLDGVVDDKTIREYTLDIVVWSANTLKHAVSVVES